jgi:methylmalonyl-CoA mutase C-terminal domain/subunit
MDTRSKRLKVLLAKSDQDAHDRGIRYVAEVLQDAGMEVIFIRYRICDQVARVALQEDVDVVGMSFYSSGHSYDIPVVLKLLKEKGKEVKLVIGGIIPSDEVPALKEMGVSGVFGPDTPTDEVIKCITA